MASSATLQGEEIPPPQESPPDTACREAQKWIEQVTGKSFGDKDFRTGLENGILLCELLNAIKPGLVKKINRLPTPIAGLDNITLFLRGCKELGLKESQLFDPGDLQDTANRTTARNSDCNRKLRNVLITVYWLGKAASSCSSYSGNNLDLKEFEGLLAQMRKENEEIESPKRSIRDSGYIDCWDSERSDSLSPPRHGRDDSFDSLDSFGSRSQQTPSPDVVLRGSSDGRGSDSESDLPHRRLPDVRKDDMSARRVSYGENKAFVPFNQYLPNKSNQTSYIPAPLRKKKAEREDYRKSWSTATSPLGGERPFRRMILSTDLANTELKITPPTLANNSPTITKVQEPDATISEDNTTAPNPEKDDMMTRRISVTQKPSCVGLGHFLPVPFSLQQKVEEKKSTSSTLSIKIKSDNCTQALAVGSSDLPCKLLGQCETEGHVELRSDVTCDQTSTEIISDGIPTGKGLDTQAEDALETCDHELFRFSPRSVLSDDGESMSMCDMRYEEEGSMQPHSRAHYEHLQHVNSLLKEEDDTWQDDLAKWKTRRRSASQDLIKKEEQRKKMERMMSGEDELSERRKSIKTYREIVEEKERREKELHEAYKNAKSRDEAEHILQSYIEKFTISEAVLEGLVMPKILERSQSVEPSLLSSSEDPNILKYLRQQSLPSPKYTSTVEATVSPSSPCEAKSPTGLISPSKNIISKTVPMLTAKPYSQPKNTQEVLKTFKVDGKVNLNGVEEQKEEEHGNQTFAPSLTRSQMFEGVARVDVPVVEIKQDVTSIELNLARPNTLNSLQEPKSLCEDRNHISQEDESDSLVQLERAHSVEILSEGNTQSSNATQDVPVVSSIEIPPLTINGKDTVDERKVEAAELIMHWSLEPNHKEAKENSLSPLKTSENLEESLQFKENESSHKVQLNITLQSRNAWRRSQFFLQPVDTECTENSPALVPSLNSPNRFCTWDPEEERKRQEKWQQEQERLLQERKIIEDTVVPLTLSPNSNAQFNISERNGNFIPALTEHVKRDQENNNEKLLTESSRTIKNETHMHSNVTQQLLLHTQEGSILGAKEKQIKGKTDKWEAEQSICIMDREELSNHVQSNECNTPTRLPLQAGCKQVTSSESSLPGDLGSPKNPITEKDAIQNMSSIIPTRGTDFKEDTMNSSQSSTSQCQSPNRSVSGKKLCSTCGLPLGKGAAMIIETLSLYFHIQCFKCGLCKGQLGDAITGTDVRIRNGLLNCNDCYMKSRTAGHPTPL
uniref:LIM and calponin homology domains 1 n=1 Tax=Xenopus tropicalis TaxID=8364 RepID=A0A6I8RPB4_XENTR